MRYILAGAIYLFIGGVISGMLGARETQYPWKAMVFAAVWPAVSIVSVGVVVGDAAMKKLKGNAK